MRLCYLVGYPVEHSVSPVIHNACFKALSLDYEYRLASVEPGELAAFMGGTMKHRRVRGCNVTIPYKVEVMRHLDEVEDAAGAIGAVNTILNDEGVLKGYNTDYLGGFKALEEEYGNLKDAGVVILGAGGAARALVYGLRQKVQSITVLNRDPEKAKALVDLFKENSNASMRHGSLGELGDHLGSADILVNTTPLGMSPHTDQTPVPMELLHRDLLVYDLVYNPVETRLLKEAERVGSKTLSGLKMLVYQGAEAFKLWTGLEPPTDLMIREAVARLEVQR
ncbi:MAG: shikimate dehydrogenase [Candidatus Bathyarchaeota archaeon]